MDDYHLGDGCSTRTYTGAADTIPLHFHEREHYGALVYDTTRPSKRLRRGSSGYRRWYYLAERLHAATGRFYIEDRVLASFDYYYSTCNMGGYPVEGNDWWWQWRYPPPLTRAKIRFLSRLVRADDPTVAPQISEQWVAIRQHIQDDWAPEILPERVCYKVVDTFRRLQEPYERLYPGTRHFVPYDHCILYILRALGGDDWLGRYGWAFRVRASTLGRDHARLAAVFAEARMGDLGPWDDRAFAVLRDSYQWNEIIDWDATGS